MSTHPIENMMQSTMESIKDMIDVNTIVGDTVVMADGTIVIPISRVSFGFVAGGGEYQSGGSKDKNGGSGGDESFPFAGGSGAGVSVSPMAFLVVSDGNVQLLPVQFNTSYERMVDKVPGILEKIKRLFESDSTED